ncbi:unnamed protein product [Phytophthora fragariaefolia]|uniref:Unnamed protein product n=1 Tax=Phytophthora fragariaefolia TaxID=1490495 RepID=A0A9W6XI04_9STRA|nr:unnamed protein product [Phytophthora fragariaefolia]
MVDGCFTGAKHRGLCWKHGECYTVSTNKVGSDLTILLQEAAQSAPSTGARRRRRRVVCAGLTAGALGAAARGARKLQSPKGFAGHTAAASAAWSLTASSLRSSARTTSDKCTSINYPRKLALSCLLGPKAKQRCLSRQKPLMLRCNFAVHGKPENRSKRVLNAPHSDSASYEQEVQRSAHFPTIEGDDEDDSELDQLLRRAMLLLRAKADKNRHRACETNGRKKEEYAAEPDEDEGDDELDQLFQRARALLLLRQRLSKEAQLRDGCRDMGEQGSKDAVELTTSEQDEVDDDLDRLLRRAMLLFAERRRLNAADNAASDNMQNVVGDSATTESDVVRLKTSRSATGSVSPDSPSLTDREDDDEEDDELDRLLARAMALLRHQLHRHADNEEELLQQTSTDADILTGSQLNKGLIHDSVSRAFDGEATPTIPNAGPTVMTAIKVDNAAVEQQSSTSRSTCMSVRADRPQLVDAAQQTSREYTRDEELLVLEPNNAKLAEENAALRQQLADRDSSARMVLLLQEQVRCLQQRERELMRALSRA